MVGQVEAEAPVSFWRAKLAGWNEAIRRNEDKFFLVLTLAIGALVGLVVVAFILVTEGFNRRLYPDDHAAWRRIVLPVAGSLFMGYLLQRFFPDARGSGIPQTKVALFVRNGKIRLRTVFGKFFCASVSLASGLALGREGPSVQIGAGIASQIGQKLGVGPERLKGLIPVGAAAALAAAFNTPIAAVLFSLEEVMGDLHAPVLGSVVLSSAISWVVLHLILGDDPLFHVPPYQLVHPVEFLLYAVLGVLGGFVSVAFVKLTLFLRGFFLRQPMWTRAYQPVFGGIVTGLLGLAVPQVLGVGYDYVNQVLNGHVVAGFLAMLVVMKLVATASCYGSGNAGGIFGPALFIGAMLGGSVGSLAHHFFPHYAGTAGAYALVGMGAAFAGIIRTPFTSVFMIFELTRDYSIVVPLMIANMISYYLSWRFQKQPIYEALSRQEGIHLPEHGGGRASGASMQVLAAMEKDAATFLPSMTVAQFLTAAPHGDCLLVENNLVIQVVPRAKIEEAFAGGRGGDALATLANEIPGAEIFPHLHVDHGLDVALQRMGKTGLSLLPVTDRANVRMLKGMVTLDGIMHAYGVQ